MHKDRKHVFNSHISHQTLYHSKDTKNKLTKTKTWCLAIILAQMYPLIRELFVNTQGNFMDHKRPLKSMSLSILRFTCAAKSTIEKLNVAKIFQNVFRGTKFLLLSCRKIYSLSTPPKNFLLLFLKTVYQYLFTFASIFVLHKQANKIVYKNLVLSTELIM